MAISSNNIQVYTTLSKELVAEIDKDARRGLSGSAGHTAWKINCDQFKLWK